MPDTIGNIEVPEIAPSGTFPITPDYGYGRAHAPQVQIHRFGSGNAKIEQRFLLGNGARRFTVQKISSNEADRVALRNFWESHYGPYGAFTFNALTENGQSTEAVTCRFAKEPLSWEFLSNQLSGFGVTLVEIPKISLSGAVNTAGTSVTWVSGDLFPRWLNHCLITISDTDYTVASRNSDTSLTLASSAGTQSGAAYTAIPAYTLNSVETRFPGTALKAALLSQVQELIPLVKIQSREAGYPAIWLSDRRVTLLGGPEGEQGLFQARLLEVQGISQSLGNESDEAQFVFGNADRVMRNLANDTDLTRADIEFSLFHVGTGIKVDLWKGRVLSWEMDAGPEFRILAAEGIYEITLPYPTRKLTPPCWKWFDDGVNCPFAGQSSGLDLVNFPSADAGACDKGYDTPNGCLAHGMKRYFGGILAEPQGVRVKDNSTGTWGFGRSPLTSVSLVNDSVHGQVLPEIYTDSDMPVNAKVAAGRDNGDFYQVLAIVGAGPIGNPSTGRIGSGHTLDGQLHHGAGTKNPDFGLREALGSDPAGGSDYFALGQNGKASDAGFRQAFSGASVYKDNFAAGVAFLDITRHDPKGLQLSRPTEHEVRAIVSRGLSGWVWTDSGDHVIFNRSTALLTNPIWIVVNAYLRARGLWSAGAAAQEAAFDVRAVADSTEVGGHPLGAALTCDELVDSLYPKTITTLVEEEGGSYETSSKNLSRGPLSA